MSLSREELGKLARKQLGNSLLDLEPTSILEFYELHFDIDIEPYRFHSGTNNLIKNIIWNGNEYFATAIEVEGFEANTMGRLPRPKVTVANSDYIISNILRDYSDFRNGKFIRLKVFLKHLDNENFEENQNPFGSSNPLNYISKETYLVSQKIIENKQLIQFELITPFDLQSLETATRSIHGRYCYWQYRGSGCGYEGDLICQENNLDFDVSPNFHIKNELGTFLKQNYLDSIIQYKWQLEKNYSIGDIVFIENLDFNGFKDPPRTFFVCLKNHISSRFTDPNTSYDLWQKDGCSKTISACKKRFSNRNYVSKSNQYIAYNDFDTNNGIMPFGGFPGTDKFNYERQ